MDTMIIARRIALMRPPSNADALVAGDEAARRRKWFKMARLLPGARVRPPPETC